MPRVANYTKYWQGSCLVDHVPYRKVSKKQNTKMNSHTQELRRAEVDQKSSFLKCLITVEKHVYYKNCQAACSQKASQGDCESRGWLKLVNQEYRALTQPNPASCSYFSKVDKFDFTLFPSEQQ